MPFRSRLAFALTLTLARVLAASSLAVFFAVGASAAGLNDTGQSQCYDAANVAVPCTAAVGGDAGANPRQDGRYGRDPASALSNQLAKIGAGSAGFDYTKSATSAPICRPRRSLATGKTTGLAHATTSQGCFGR
jgi:hypothetical protein